MGRLRTSLDPSTVKNGRRRTVSYFGAGVENPEWT
jgi:hypothetical protein